MQDNKFIMLWISIVLWIVSFFCLSLFGFKTYNDLKFTREELRQSRVTTDYYMQRFANCKTQLGVFYRDPCIDNPELEICE